MGIPDTIEFSKGNSLTPGDDIGGHVIAACAADGHELRLRLWEGEEVLYDLEFGVGGSVVWRRRP